MENGWWEPHPSRYITWLIFDLDLDRLFGPQSDYMTDHETNGHAEKLPWIIQGGMGVGVSNWVLANAVSKRGQLGVVSGTCVDSILVRRLQDGDIGGHV